MLSDNFYQEYEFDTVYVNELVPENHQVRLIDMTIDFEFIYGEVAHLYSKNNYRPAIDPVKLFKTLLLGYLFGINSERRLVEEIQANIAYRWFLDIGLTEEVIHHSTLSHTRIQYFKDSDIYMTIFNNIVNQALTRGLIGYKGLKSHTNKRNCCEIKDLQLTPSAYVQKLNDAMSKDKEEVLTF
jgi:transposase